MLQILLKFNFEMAFKNALKNNGHTHLLANWMQELNFNKNQHCKCKVGIWFTQLNFNTKWKILSHSNSLKFSDFVYFEKNCFDLRHCICSPGHETFLSTGHNGIWAWAQTLTQNNFSY